MTGPSFGLIKCLATKQEYRRLLHQIQNLTAGSFQPIGIRSGQSTVLGPTGESLDDMKHGGPLLLIECLLDDLGLLQGDLKLPGEAVYGAFRVFYWRFGGDTEAVMAPLRLADNAL